jgi:lysosomal alpha-mannosidase
MMIHRRLVYSESTSLGEPLNETAFGKGLVVRGKHILIFETPINSAIIHRVNAQQLYMHPIATFALTNDSYEIYSTNYRQTWSAIKDEMPLNIHLLTFDQLGSEKYLIRIEHFFQQNEDAIFSKAVKIDLQKLFNNQGQIIDLIELTLAANLPLNDMKRLNWTTNDNQSSHWNINSKIFSFHLIMSLIDFVCDLLERMSLKDTTITLNPMQIKTFQVTVQK